MDNWFCSIDSALDIARTDARFASWRDIVDYDLIANHRMKATRESGATENIDLTQYE